MRGGDHEQVVVRAKLSFARNVRLRVGEIRFRELQRREGLAPARDEIAIVELGEELALLDAIADFHVQPPHDAGNPRPDANLGADHRLDDAGGLDGFRLAVGG